ncbi:hypothetical protein B0H17DRAFT_568926 [Mycena rosella]|uniref:Uncharacterized protein n=1 Tax=Mycena rosella TaxID=1033263 RepID=A0AAD7M9D6_MYCRO|nr:hypothetical protein B0H17DRAFT_568926 [Mycena rosella]
MSREPRAAALAMDAPDGDSYTARRKIPVASSSVVFCRVWCAVPVKTCSVGPTLPTGVVLEAQPQAYIELSRLSYILHSSPPCIASDSPLVPRTPCSRRSVGLCPPILHVGVHERERGCAILACEGRIGFHNRPGVDLTTGLVDIGFGIRWRLTLPLPSPPPLPTSITNPSFPAPSPASILHAHRERERECEPTHLLPGADSLTRA